jgi:hypothetical protein
MMKTYFKSGIIKKVIIELKSYLYKQVLVSIRLNIPSQNIRYQIENKLMLQLIRAYINRV